MTKVAPTVEEVEELRRAGHQGPVVMINLMKFRTAGGRDIYRRYFEVAGRAIADVEAKGAPPLKRLYSGVAGADFADGQIWDWVSAVEYADVQHFADVMMHPIYRAQALPLRQQAVERAMFMISFPAGIGQL